ncbi:MAG TPA: hypothetical protein O0X23_02820, partial [Methanocorpusculum sp.]|nr:hypothetical protein [Methanocorpusculum sp.]
MVKTVVCMSVGTGGADANDRRNLASALADSLFDSHPDEIIFFVSKESCGTVDLISSGYKETFSEDLPSHELVILDSVDDFDYCFTKISQVVVGKQKGGYHVFLDYTSGTKTMTMVLGVVAVLYHCNLLLTEGKRDEHGKVHPGSERVVEQRLFAAYDEMLFEDVVRMFHANRFAEALDMLGKNLIMHEFRDVMISVCHAFQYWDHLKYQDALTEFKKMDTDKAKMLIP